MDSAEDMRQLLVRNRQMDELSGYLSVGLALMENRQSLETINDILASSTRRPELQRQAILASAILGGDRSRELAEAFLNEGAQTLTRLASDARALGRIGSVEHLTEVAGDESRTDLVRAAALAALGLRASTREEPWDARIIRGLNYRAVTPFLIHSGPPGLLNYY